MSLKGVSSGTLVVIQIPGVSFMEGETVNITCCWTEILDRVRVTWLKNQSKIKSESNSNGSQVVLKEEGKNCASLNFSKITTEDSGTYICKVTVEIPSLTEVKGNGTVITVREKTENDTDGQMDVIAIILLLQILQILGDHQSA
uniref:Ig-like domain-containing protein n=1 Tax=Oreochromis niloticus TaxID=8128 RepID=A0A669F0N6_ORENI